MKMNSNNMVQVFTSLPPCIKKVDPFFYLHFQINYIKFTAKTLINYENIDAKVLWWGEEGNGSVFTPRCVNLAGYKQIVKTYAIYKVCVPLHHFTTYLCDMDKLYIDIVDKTKNSVVGRAVVEDIKQLGCNKAFQSLCNIYNETRNKIGELMISMTIEPGTASSSSNIDLSKTDRLLENRTEILTNERERPLNREQTSPKVLQKLTDSLERLERSHDLIDDVLEKGKRLRERIANNVRDDEINEDIARKTFSGLDQEPSNLHPSDNEWLKRVFAEQSSNNFSLNDISKINTESILELSPQIGRKHFDAGDKCNLNNDTAALKLLTVSDSYCSEYDTDIGGLYKGITRSFENIVDYEKQLSSDDDPGKHDSIIEELFYKQTVSDNDVGQKNISKTKKEIDTNNNKFNGTKTDFEIYKSLSQNQKCEIADDMNRNFDDDFDVQPDDEIIAPGDNSAGNWYRNISSIRVFIDMLWLNPSNQSPNKASRSRSQSPNCSSDRERCRRSQDSASSLNNSSVSTTASKPPVSRSLQWNPSCKYFVEYKFPACLPEDGDREKENYNQTRCPIRVPVISMIGSSGNSASTGVRAFELNHSSEFPVSFNDATIAQWWKGVVRFRLISQDYANKEAVVGVSVLTLRNVISTNNFYRLIPVRLPRNKLNKSRIVVGSLAIRTTMTMATLGNVNDQYSRDSSKNVRHRQIPVSSIQPQQYHVPRSMSTSHRNNSNQRMVQYRPQKSAPLRQTAPPLSRSTKMSPINLVSLLCASNVRYINTKMVSGDYKAGTRSCNLYLIGRLLWAPDHKIKSRILWGSSKISDSESSVDLENFKMSEKIPLILTVDLLDRLRNNFAVLEVWDKSLDNTKDCLYGIVKIPMNILGMSFSNDHIRRTVLGNVYPVMCCDDWANVEDPLTGKSKGQIHVMLALGSHQQIDNLELSKENTADGHWNRNFMATTVSNIDMVEHSIEIDLESLRNVDLSISTELALKETFCYIQYYFPQQQTITDCNAKTWTSAIFRSVSHPIQSNVDISDSNKHRFRLPIDCSLKGALNNHFEAMGKKYLLFELYTKQYNPFPCSRSIAKGRLQVASLFQLINQHSVSVDSMADTLTRQQMPIRLVIGNDPDSVNSIGTLNIGVCYRTKLIENGSRNMASSSLASPLDQPIVKIEVISGTGLQKASEALLRIHPELEYASVTGVNSHVKYWITDESNKQSRINVNSMGFQKFKIHRSKTVPHSFVPKYDSINEALLGPIIDDRDSNSLCRTLAEKLLMGVYQFNVELYHDVPKSIYCDFEDVASLSTILIGKGRISMADMLLRSSGIMGPIWLTLFSPMNLDAGFGGCKLNIAGKRKFDSLYSIEKRLAVGALEVRLSLNDKCDRKNILQLAMDAGYVVPWTTRLETEDLIWQSMDVQGCSFKNITVTVEEVELSAKLVNCVFTPEAGFKRSSMKIITRYRIYKQSIASSPYFMLNEEELMERIFIPVNHQQQYCYRVSSDLFRYLRESKLEVQVWSIYGASQATHFDNDYEQSENPNDVRLLGSAFFDLSSLILPTDGNNKTVSHILPLWKRGIPNCDNANVTVTVEICGATSPLPNYTSDNEDCEYGTRANQGYPFDSRSKTIGKGRIDHQKSFPAHVIIEKAVNLNRSVGRNDNRSQSDMCGKLLNYFVSFPRCEESKDEQSPIVKGHQDVTWNFECDTRLSYELLTDNENNLDFRLYYSVTESEIFEEIYDQKVLAGTARVDLSLLLKGFERVIGWYNIVDMQGDCQGQLKIGVTPLVPLVPKSAVLSKAKSSMQTISMVESRPLTLEDHQDYLANVRMRLRGEVGPMPTLSSAIPQWYGGPGDSSQNPANQDCLSKSMLYNTLNEKLKELENFNEIFTKKISNDECVQVNGNDNNNAAVEVFPPEVQVSRPNVTEDCRQPITNASFELSKEMGEKMLINRTPENDFNDIVYDSGSDFYEDQDEEGNLSKMVCINDTDENQGRCNRDSFVEEYYERDSLSPAEHVEERNQTVYDSESDCSIVLSNEVIPGKQIMSGRTTPASSHRNYDEVEIDEILGSTNEPRRTMSPSQNNLRDSWESTASQNPVNIDREINHPSTSEAPVKSNATKTIIPRFFPPSLDFQEKMKALKRTIEVERPSTTNANYRGKEGSSARKTHINDISESEARRLSRIFGIK